VETVFWSDKNFFILNFKKFYPFLKENIIVFASPPLPPLPLYHCMLRSELKLME